MIRFLPAFLFSWFIVGCSSNPEGITVKGTIIGGKGKTIYLTSSTRTDSAIIDSENHFEIYTGQNGADYYNLYLVRTDAVLLYLDSGDVVTIEANGEKISNDYQVEGSSVCSDIKMLQDQLNQTFQAVKGIYDSQMAAADSSNIDSLKTLVINESNKVIQNHREKVFDFIKKNPSSMAVLPAIYQAFDSRNPIFRYDVDAQYFDLIDSALLAANPDSRHVKEYHSQMVQLKQQIENANRMQQGGIQVGSMAPDFTVNTPDGQKISLSSLKGKYILLDFWASWCAPCRQENPNLVNAYRLFRKKGFDVFQVSLDKSKEDWIKAIDKDQLTWKHGSDLQYWNSAPAQLYGVQSIPSNYLIDPTGKVVAKNLRGQALHDKLAEVLK